MTVATVGTWEARGVSVAEVEAALSDLRSHDRRAAVRTSVLTLVVVASSEARAESAREVVSDLGGRNPSRAVLIVLSDEDVAEPSRSIDASAAVRAVAHESVTTSYDEISLRVRGRARFHLDSIVEPLLLPDVPVVVWLPSDLPSPGDPLLAAADRVIVDSRAVAEEGDDDRHQVLPRIAALTRRLPVADLSWHRLAWWRTLLAGHFDNPAYRPFLRAVDNVEVAGNFGPRHLLGGWLLQRLALTPERMSLEPANHVSVRIRARHEGQRATFAVERPGPERTVDAWARVGEHPEVRQTLTMHRTWPALALAGALTRMGPDAVYREALDGAAALLAGDRAR